MTRVLCDAMDCAHIRPIGTSVRKRPYLGYCQKELVNIAEHIGHSGGPTCITHSKKETEQRSGE